MTNVMVAPGTVLVATPEELVGDVLRLIHDGRSAGPAVPAPGAQEETAEVPGQGTWTRRMVAAFVEESPYPLALELVDRCAARPGEWVEKSEVDGAEHQAAIQLRNELGAMSKASKRLFDGRKKWPFEWRRTKGVYEYRMPETTAAWWREVREVR